MGPKLLVLGLDGADPELMRRFTDLGYMPFLKSLMQAGISGELESVLPTNSMSAWASFMTGMGPGKHGILEFRSRHHHQPFQQSVVNARLLRQPTLWDHLTQHGVRSGVINMPLTYPPKAVNGFMVTGMLTPTLHHRFTHPEELQADLLAAVPDYRIAVPWKYYENRPLPLVADLAQMMRSRFEAACYLFDHYQPDVCSLVFVVTDRIQHCLWPQIQSLAQGDGSDELAKAIRALYRELDGMIEQLVDRYCQDADLIILSDHGFREVSQTINLNTYLQQQGYLVVKRPPAMALTQLARKAKAWIKKRTATRLGPRALSHLKHPFKLPKMDIDWHKTTAYTDLAQGLYLNLSGRESAGSVLPTRKDHVMEEIAARLNELRDPLTGQQTLAEIVRGESYYQGPFAVFAPDLILIEREGYAVDSKLQLSKKPSLFAPSGWASGAHRLEGFFLGYGPSFAADGQVASAARIIDLTPTALHLLGLPVPTNLDGKVLVDALDTNARQRAVSYVDPSYIDGQDDSQAEVSQEDMEIISEQLRGLGYL